MTFSQLITLLVYTKNKMLLLKTLFLIFLVVLIDFLFFPVVRNLVGEPDYRQVRLHWEVDTTVVPKNGFSVRYCELQTWGAQRCRNQTINETDGTNSIVGNEGYKTFAANIKGLRMATTYSFEVKSLKEESKAERTDRAEGDDKNQNMIVIPTKGCK